MPDPVVTETPAAPTVSPVGSNVATLSTATSDTDKSYVRMQCLGLAMQHATIAGSTDIGELIRHAKMLSDYVVGA